MGNGDTWNPSQYDRFRAEREQPFHDLVSLLAPAPGGRVVDLGCGTGALTRQLLGRLEAASVVGVDSSAAMIAAAAQHADDAVTFRRARIEDVLAEGDAVDVFVSNAALHWLPDHAAVFGALARALRPAGGQLAVQMPMNQDHPTHTVAAALCREEPWAPFLRDGVRQFVLPVEAYARLLHELGFARQSVRLQVYGHVLERREDVVEWVRGALLTDIEARLSPALFAAFLARYRAELLAALEPHDAAPTRGFFFPFKRLLLWAQR